MGVPKFFRWISERYPTISQLIGENGIPEFDNLYLDMNGIIHNCTHKDGQSAAFRMGEDQMFISIFNYIEHLYGKIKPKKVFFMAIDGVAPRAKMNQQRSRRFRTALDNEKALQEAIRKGVEMPKEDPFDSNCITPGTAFMARLTQQLKYFVAKKVSEDIEWQGVEIILSGHEVPGEGEHKIMEYIRLAKAQPEYNPNIRHCLYGLDADLIMLGLLSHDPHFCLLREEVTFGRASKEKSKELEHQNFYLMHLSVVREYLEHEFQDLKEPGVLSFPFDLERIIDDFILLAFFVGNDFLPNLPNLHINEGALALQFRTYKEVLPKCDGYINEHGVINLNRLRLLLDELSQFEQKLFLKENDDAKWLKSKGQHSTLATIESYETAKSNGKIIMTKDQMALFKQIRGWLNSQRKKDVVEPTVLDLDAKYPARDRKFVEGLAYDLRIKCERILDDNGETHQQLSLPPRLDDGEDDEEEAESALLRVLRQYERAKVMEISPEQIEEEKQKRYDERFIQWKDEYYKGKFQFGLDDHEDMKALTENYVEGLQWVLYYYYRGVASWPWFYKYHYAPRISDIAKGLGANLKFELGQPFRPFEQLMGVLPDRSKKIVPEAYHKLMTSPDSPIIDFYPRDFELDMNGKKMEWEAVVKIPFIDQDRLLKAMKTVEHLLTDEERRRNDYGVTLKFTFDPNADYLYESSMPGVFPDIVHCRCTLNIYELPTLDGLDIIVGLCDGAKIGANALAGFPSLATLKHIGQLGFHGVNVFQQDSRQESMVITLENAYADGKVEEAKTMIGKRTFVGYPFLQEAKVNAVSDEMFKYVLGEDGRIIQIPHGPHELNNWRRKADSIENRYSKRMGIVTGPVEVIFHVDMLKGMRHTDEGALIKEYDHIPGVDTDYAAQTVVWDVISEDQRYIEKAPLPITEDFPVGAKAFFLGEYNFGRPLEVIGHHENTVDVWVHTMVKPGNGPQRPPHAVKEPEFTKDIVREAENITKYKPAYRLARELKINPLVLSKITSSFQAMVDGKRLNLGLNLKFEAKQRKVLGYSRKNEGGWEFSVKAEELIREYMIKFPQFFERLMANPNGDLYRDTDFYDPSESKAKIEEITSWLKSVDARGLERVPLEAEQLEAEVVMMIQGAIDSFDHGIADARRINKVPRKALLKPSDAEHRLADQRFTIGDRVVYVQESGKVPIGARGTVVGLTRTTRQTLLDVVWDITFMAGTTLGNRCSPFRGMTVPVSSVLNLTSRQLISSTKASDRRANAVKHTPPPPLSGSFADAILGNASNNTKPQPVFYPPPPSLNGQQGRGRGGFRGRGGHAQNQNQSSQQQHQNGGPASGPANGPARGGFAPRGTTILSRRGGAPGQPQVMQRPRGGGVPGLVVPPSSQQVDPHVQQQIQQVQQHVQQQVQQQVQQSQQVQQPQRQPQGPQQQQFQNVPPAANFNRGRGRGRGPAARGRGAPFRGRGGAGAQLQGENGEA